MRSSKDLCRFGPNLTQKNLAYKSTAPRMSHEREFIVMKVKHAIIINRPIDQVFAFVTNLHNETRWQPEIQSVTLEGPLQSGSTFREVRVTFGRTYDWYFRITEFDPPHCITIDTISGTARYRGSRIFEAVAGGTKVTEIGELELPRLLRVLNPLLSRLSQWPLRRAYGRLKRIIENGT